MPVTVRNDLRRELLDTARWMLVREGYQNISMRKVATKVGVTATSIYLHFRSKDDLLHALIEEGFELHYDKLKAAMQAESDPMMNIKALCRAHVRFGLDYPEYFEIMFQLHPEQMSRYPVEKYRRATRNIILFQAVMQEGIQKGIFRKLDTILASHTIWAALHGTVSLLLANRIHVSFNRNDLIEETLHGIQRYLANETI